MIENQNGAFVRGYWEALPDHYSNVALDAFVIMPDHVHGIVVLGDRRDGAGAGDRAGLKPAPTGGDGLEDAGGWHGLAEVVRAFKTFSARRINAMRGTPGVPVWQRGYYERIIRDHHALKNIREYIHANPQRQLP